MRRVLVGFAAALNMIAAAACAPVRHDDPVCEIAASGDVDALERLIATGELDVRSDRGHMALVCAVRSDRAGAVAVLLRNGADPNRTDERGNRWTPLLHAVHKHAAAALRVLLAAGADPNIGSPSLVPLIMAAGYGYPDMVDLLLAHGADPYAQTNDGVTVLGAAVGGTPDIDRFTIGHCQTDTVRALLTRAPDLQLQDRLWDRLAVTFARVGGCQEVLKLVGRS